VYVYIYMCVYVYMLCIWISVHVSVVGLNRNQFSSSLLYLSYLFTPFLYNVETIDLGDIQIPNTIPLVKLAIEV